MWITLEVCIVCYIAYTANYSNELNFIEVLISFQ